MISSGPGSDAAAYVAIANLGGTPDRLLSARCACAARVELHRVVRQGAKVSMESDWPLAIAPGARTEVKPGTPLHLMLMELNAPLVAARQRAGGPAVRARGRGTRRFPYRRRQRQWLGRLSGLLPAPAGNGLPRTMARPIILYGIALAAVAFLLEWLNYKHLVYRWSTEFYVACIAVLCVALGIWVGNRLTARPRRGFVRNDAAIASLGISARECEVLEMLAAGHANKVIARRLDISPNTVKTHIARLYEKLEVASRTQAVQKAQALDILP
ncbi:LuxR C-terminal-related transcriptional regulator [Sphingopyxis sp. PET50]|uniref:LuxR C-terminal-related transcriptional regulator n=1 Tax=Sphingopyxis sp. PET50 TaxID=2976533 RepID=UPI0021AECBA7|nr:LuxR C-terminal-related transcriptional regulator [Sphingopyxis sp. PET50]